MHKRYPHSYAVNQILENADISVATAQQMDSKNLQKQIIDSEIKQFHDVLTNEMQDMSRLKILKTLKSDFQFEKYIVTLSNRKQRSLFAKTRMGTLPLKVETGRYRGIPRDERICVSCNLGVVEDEGHVFFKCPKYKELRDQYLNDISDLISTSDNLCDNDILKDILCCDSPLAMFSTVKYLYNVFNIRAS